MTRKIFLMVALAASLVFLMGCMAPEYQFCCYKGQALPEDPDDAVCRGMSEEGEEVDLEVVECSEEDWACELVEKYTSGENEGENKVAPICPNIETTPCNTTCAGVFCGSFFYDPRPLAAGYGSEESHTEPEEEGDGESMLSGEPMGLWNAQCQVKNMSPLFLRQVENSDNIVMNKFRFGVGQSFQDFEDAQYYFPLSDRACYLNPSGSVDRYTVYAIEGDICPWSGSKYECIHNEEIESYSFYDCALRCNLYYKGYAPELEPFNPYLTKGVSGQSWEGHDIPFYSGIPYAYPGTETGDARSPGSVGFGSDLEYPLQGTILYGASFGYSHVQPPYNGGFMPLSVYNTQGIERDGTVHGKIVPRIGSSALNFDNWPETAFNYITFNQEDNANLAARDVFFTTEGSSQAVYPWLLAHHSVYNYQFRHGHFLPDGTEKGGAEFECTNGADCLSGYCNNFDYKRGVCTDADGNDILCDCKSEMGTITCMGGGTDWMDSWDEGSADMVELPTSRSAAVDYGGGDGENHWDWGQSITSIPSYGKVVEVQFYKNSDHEEPMPGEALQGPVPMFVLYLGGPTSLPDYITRTWDSTAGGAYMSADSDDPEVNTFRKSFTEMGMVLHDLNPCMVFPSDQKAPWDESQPLSFMYSYWSLKSLKESNYNELEKMRFCCDGTTNCLAGEGETVIGYGDPIEDYDPPNNAGYLQTRFIDECMKGYESDVHICYNKDPAAGGWSYGNTGYGWKNSPSRAGYVNRPLRDYLETTDSNWGLCEVLGEGSAFIDSETGEDVECYQWKLGGPKRSGDEDTCELQAETYVVVEPRWDEELGRFAFGNCLLNQNGDDLEIKEYGVCESCGYLTMAKQDINLIPTGWVDEFDPAVVDAEQTYGSTYCPDLEISTPYGAASTGSQLSYALEGYDLDGNPEIFYAIEPQGMNGYINYKYGENIWGSEEVDMPERCTYPNGYTVFEDIDGDDPYKNTARGLPDIYPNAYYINKKLESMMKRNIQPVIFATSSYLWADDLWASGQGDPGEEDTDLVFLRVEDGDPYWSTFELLKDLYETREYLFEIGQAFGVQLDEDDNYDMATYTAGYGGKFLGNTVINEGAAIIVIYDLEGSDDDPMRSGADDAAREVPWRALTTRTLCPNCMTSVSIGYGTYSDSTYDYEAFEGMEPGELDAEGRAAEIDNLFEDGYWVYERDVDVISMNVVIRDDDFCSISNEEERFAAILGNLSYIGTHSLKNYEKPMLITDFVIEHTGIHCWDTASAGRLMTYLGVHASDLSKSGYLGLIYGEWRHDFNSYSQNNLYESSPIMGKYGDLDYRDAFFEGTYVAARKFAGHSIMTYYMEVPESEVCKCTPCTMADKPELCNGKYLGEGKKCSGYNDGDYSRWPDNCITGNVCDYYGGAVNREVACQITHDNGTVESREFCGYDIEETPSGFRDVIASLEDSNGAHLTWCFPLGEDQVVTYQKSDHHSYSSLPAVFSMDGNTSIQCNPGEGLMDSFCGYYPPITKYQMSCVFSGEYCELGEEYDSDIPLE